MQQNKIQNRNNYIRIADDSKEYEAFYGSVTDRDSIHVSTYIHTSQLLLQSVKFIQLILNPTCFRIRWESIVEIW